MIISLRSLVARTVSTSSRMSAGTRPEAAATSRSVRLVASGVRQLVRGVRHELALGVEGRVQALQHHVEGVGEFLDLIGRPGQRDPVPQVAVAARRAVWVMRRTGRSARPAMTQPEAAATAATAARASRH